MTTPKEVAADIVCQYSFVLNTPEYRGKNVTGAEFAKLIAEVYDVSIHGVNHYAAIIAEDYIASIRYEVTGRVAWKFKGKEA